MTDRAVSTALSYALILGIVTLLVTSLTMGFGALVSNQQVAATQSTLDVIGNDIAGDVASVDRLANSAGPEATVSHRKRLPTRVGGSPYTIEIADDPEGAQRYNITVESIDDDRRAEIDVRTRTPIETEDTDPIDGGPIEIEYDGEKLVVSNA